MMDLSTDEVHNLGKSLILVGRDLRDGKSPNIDETTLRILIGLADQFPEAPKKHFGPAAKTDELMELILKWLREGEAIPTGYDHPGIMNAITKLRRNGQIFNEGTHRKPRWRLTTPEEQERLAEETREKRRKYDREKQKRAGVKNG